MFASLMSIIETRYNLRLKKEKYEKYGQKRKVKKERERGI